MATFVLLHGSFHAAWNWHKVIPLLERAGHRAIAIDLPGHGHDSMPPCKITLECCVERVVRIVDECDDPVLVAHSRNGIVISQAAQHRPERIKGLIYLAAYLVPNGRSMMDYAVTDADSLVLQNSTAKVPSRWLPQLVRWLRFPALCWLAMKCLPRSWQVHRLNHEVFREALYHDCPSEITELANVLLEPEPHWPGFAPLHLTEARYGRVPRLYIECLSDCAVTPALQRRMLADSPGTPVVSFNSGHSPFFSQPERLTEVLCEGLNQFDEARDRKRNEACH